jgi:phage tail sheath gpL-like
MRPGLLSNASPLRERREKDNTMSVDRPAKRPLARTSRLAILVAPLLLAAVVAVVVERLTHDPARAIELFFLSLSAVRPSSSVEQRDD